MLWPHIPERTLRTDEYTAHATDPASTTDCQPDQEEADRIGEGIAKRCAPDARSWHVSYLDDDVDEDED